MRASLVWPRDRAKIAADVLDMRERIAKEKGTEDIWDLKQVRGGLVDVEFIAQYLQLVHAEAHPGVLDQNTIEAYRKLRDAGLLAHAHADVLIPATRLLHDLTQIVRLCLEGRFDPATAPSGLKDLLARAGDAPSFPVLEARSAGEPGRRQPRVCRDYRLKSAAAGLRPRPRRNMPILAVLPSKGRLFGPSARRKGRSSATIRR